MSENLDLVRSIYADWERGDFSRVEWADPEIALAAVGGTEPGTFSGLAAVGLAFNEWLGAWENFRVAAESYRELDDGRVVVLFRVFGRARITGLDLDRVGATVFEGRGGKVTRLVAHYDRDRALADLGLKG